MGKNIRNRLFRSFIDGILSLSVNSRLDFVRVKQRRSQSDNDRLRSDWQRVGEDIYKAIDMYRYEQ